MPENFSFPLSAESVESLEEKIREKFPNVHKIRIEEGLEVWSMASGNFSVVRHENPKPIGAANPKDVEKVLAFLETGSTVDEDPFIPGDLEDEDPGLDPFTEDLEDDL